MPPLSRQQRSILLHLCRLYQAEDPHEREHVGVFWGVRGTPVRQASLSRSLRRLEARHLLVRLRQPPGKTWGVRVLPAGLAMADRFTQPPAGGC